MSQYDYIQEIGKSNIVASTFVVIPLSKFTLRNFWLHQDKLICAYSNYPLQANGAIPTRAHKKLGPSLNASS